MDSSKLDALSQFIQLGWALIPLHDVTSGVCSCQAGAECRSAGKHPRNKAWQSSGWVREVGVLASIVADRPGWNWGAVTGAPSRIWTLDVDPDNGGMESLAELVERCGTSAHLGAHRVHRTGGDGLHLIYAIGDDGWMPRTGAGKLAPGLDVRAEGGQIVLPTSVSGKGAYGVVRDLGVQVVGAMLRGEIERRLAPAHPRDSMAIGLLDSSEQNSVTDGGDRYARAVVETLVAEMRDAPVGTRNDTGFRTAVRIWELVLAPWNSLDEADVIDEWWAAAGATGAPPTELQGLWGRGYGRAAERAAGGEGAVLPASGIVTGERVPFVGSAVPPDVDPAAWRAAHPEVDLSAADLAVERMRGKILPRSRFGTLRRPTYLIEDTLNLASDTWLIGTSGSYKSFVALDWACHVATGKLWNGRRIRQGKVVMVIAEGAAGIEQRVAAWERLNGTTVGDELMMLPESVYASSGARAGSTFGERISMDWWALGSIVATERPALVLVDTQARMTTGLNENDNSDMAFWTEAVAHLRVVSGACLLVVHHVGRKGTDARGGSAIDAAQDMEWTVARGPDDGGIRTAKIVCTKNKDAADRAEHALTLEVVELGEDDEGKPITSLGVRVLAAGQAPAPEVGPFREAVPELVRMSVREERALLMYRVALETVPDVGATESEIRALFRGLPAVAGQLAPTQRQFAGRAWNDLVALGLIMKQDGRERYRVVVLPDQTERGALTPNPISRGWMAPDGWSVVRVSDDSV